MCFIDYDRQIAFIAERRKAADSPGEIVGVARLIKSMSGCEAEVAAVVSDAFQRKGIGRKLVHRLIEFARDENLTALTASVLTENWAMQKLLEAEGFRFRSDNDLNSCEGEMYFALKEPAHSEPAT
jgi:acetyltransferase